MPGPFDHLILAAAIVAAANLAAAATSPAAGQGPAPSPGTMILQTRVDYPAVASLEFSSYEACLLASSVTASRYDVMCMDTNDGRASAGKADVSGLRVPVPADRSRKAIMLILNDYDVQPMTLEFRSHETCVKALEVSARFLDNRTCIDLNDGRSSSRSSR